MFEGQVGKICLCRIFKNEDLAEAIKKRVEESDVKTGIFISIGSLEKTRSSLRRSCDERVHRWRNRRTCHN